MPKERERATESRLEGGRVLFNQRRFFEAHEAWEEVWLHEEGPARRALQGLIQIAAGFLKAQGGAARSCVRLLEAGLEKLSAGFPDPALEAFAGHVRESLEQARRWERGEKAGLSTFPEMAAFGVK